VGPIELGPAMCLKDSAACSDKEHRQVDLLGKGIDSLGQHCGGGKGVGESPLVLVHVVVHNNAPEVLCPAVAQDGHFKKLSKMLRS
jgi:hypothetical protein